jgi:hypothetical protein
MASLTHSRRGVFLETLSTSMFLSFAVAATVLASPPQTILAKELPKGALFHALALAAPAQPPSHLGGSNAEPDRTPNERMRGWLGQLAVVKPPHSAQRAVPVVQMFLTLAPVGRQVGLLAIGSF